MQQVETCPRYAEQVSPVLASELSDPERQHIDAAYASRREGLLLDAKRTWEDFFKGNQVWTEAMERYWQCLITLHYERAGTPSPIDPTANMSRRGGSTRAGFYQQISARGD